jgi:hypothetical protein
MTSTWHGLPVPWVTRWTAEANSTGPRLVWRDDRLAYDDEIPGDRQLGALWYRNLIGRHGEPELAQLHVARQRRAMLRGLCQVCGQAAAGPDGRLSWLVPGTAAITEGWRTATPPVCAGCRPVAARSCPHLRAHPPAWASAGRVVPVAVIGDAYQQEGGHLLAASRQLSAVALSDQRGLRHVLAKQLMAGLHDIRNEEPRSA